MFPFHKGRFAARRDAVRDRVAIFGYSQKTVWELCAKQVNPRRVGISFFSRSRRSGRILLISVKIRQGWSGAFGESPYTQRIERKIFFPTIPPQMLRFWPKSVREGQTTPGTGRGVSVVKLRLGQRARMWSVAANPSRLYTTSGTDAKDGPCRPRGKKASGLENNDTINARPTRFYGRKNIVGRHEWTGERAIHQNKRLSAKFPGTLLLSQ